MFDNVSNYPITPKFMFDNVSNYPITPKLASIGLLINYSLLNGWPICTINRVTLCTPTTDPLPCSTTYTQLAAMAFTLLLMSKETSGNRTLTQQWRVCLMLAMLLKVEQVLMFHNLGNWLLFRFHNL